MATRSEVLKLFKLLHRTKNKVFDNDIELINVLRQEINDQFKQNKFEKDREKIDELVKDGFLAEEELRTKFIQVVEVKPGYYKTKLREDHCMSEKALKPKKPKNN